MDGFAGNEARARLFPATARAPPLGVRSLSDDELDQASAWDDMPRLEPTTATAGTSISTPALRVMDPEEEGPMSCFICLGSSDEDDGPERKWTHACACSLVAHEECLLEWIVEQNRSGTPHCPGQ